MPFYQKRGKIPEKRHIQFRDEKKDLYWEELISRQGFSHIYSNVYHINPPTAITEIGEPIENKIKTREKINKHYHLKTATIKSSGDAVSSRVPLFFNQDIIISKCHIENKMDYLFKNARADEILFIQSGKGTFKSNFGFLDLSFGDYVIIPRGVIWMLEITDPMKVLSIESKSPIETPKRYRNEFGQLLDCLLYTSDAADE